MIKSAITVGTIFLASLLNFGGQEEQEPALPGLEQLKALAGDWVAVGEDGKPGEELSNSFRVVAGGTTVMETVFPGTPNEMITMYHMNGKDLMLTHYCMLGNQPRMRVDKAKSNQSKLAFKAFEVMNTKSEAEPAMRHGSFEFLGKDKIRVVLDTIFHVL